MSDFTFRVEASHVLMFARALGVPDAERTADGNAGPTNARAQAPLTFLQASAQFDPDYPLRPRPDRPWLGSGREPSGSRYARDPGGTQLHAEQHFEFQRPVVVGDVLHVTRKPGREWSKAGRRGGTLAFCESLTEFRDESSDLVATIRQVVVNTSQVVRAVEDD